MGHLLHQADGDDALDALEAVLPGHHQPDRRPVLGGQGLAVEPHREEGCIASSRRSPPRRDNRCRPQGAGGLPWQLFRIIERLEGPNLARLVGSARRIQIRQRNAAQGSTMDQASTQRKPIDALLQRALVDEIPHPG